MHGVWCGQLLGGIKRGVVQRVCCGLGDEHRASRWRDHMHEVPGGHVLDSIKRDGVRCVRCWGVLGQRWQHLVRWLWRWLDHEYGW